jgi:hypothetical protein
MEQVMSKAAQKAEAKALAEAEARAAAEKLEQVAAKQMARFKGMAISDLIDLYMSFRTALEDEAKILKAKIDKGKAIMDRVEAALNLKMKDAGTDTASSEKGTAFFTTKTYCGVADWDELLPFILDGNTHFLKKDVAKSAVEEYMTENENELPPGVKWTEEKAIQIRKK